ncbi:hypothetical protein BD324DRAFT_648233 [Kockovaella imperatae]|uniref:HSF-type DNA-binding domain-containing protein n=1 Tax=Kockovaella imperatae TaxID=4999 RepID=A0A1Y1UNM0_9TREE|nr:hypothetical protein BD324DRAFT_648233 [Kockovaella imperatae]ORX39592.1 hypothetical protein BD324DRAFT_648233 [Kockovaella imperatae]
MTTNLQAVAGPSKINRSPKVEPASPDSDTPSASDLKEISAGSTHGISKQGMTIDDKGEVTKVPAFLNKLFSMVSDSATDELIYWSDAGTSFFVPNTERFGKELLPRFFKHSNFSSFVRQLNMYGFHKVPQPQTGVLKSDNPDGSELWEFTNPCFKRDHPELLGRVTRKNNRPGVNMPASGRGAESFSGNQYHPVHLITDGSTKGEAGGGVLVGPTGQQMLDLSAITSGIAAIRQTQASIGADLKALQTSNEHLWREALEARDIHRKHEETIDLIVTFLERLFGTEGEGLKGLKEAMRRGGMGRSNQDGGFDDPSGSKKRRRVGVERMISDGREEADVDENGQIVELPSESATPSSSYRAPQVGRKRSRGSLKPEPLSANSETWSSTSQRFQALPDDSPQLQASPVTRSPGSNTSQNPRTTYPANPNLSAKDPGVMIPYGNNTQTDQQLAQALNLDPSILQTTIGSLLQSPAAAEMFLNSLNNSIQGQALQTPGGNIDPRISQAQPQTTSTTLRGNSAPSQTDPTLALFSPLPNQTALMENNDALIKSYQQAAAMGGDVEKLQESIDSLIRSMGLDLPTDDGTSGLDADALANLGVPNLNGVTTGLSQGGSMNGATADSINNFDTPAFAAAEDFDVDQFLHSLSKENETESNGDGQ